MTIVVQDLFVEASDTSLGLHTPDVDTVGSGWNIAGTATVRAATDSVSVGGGNNGFWIDTGVTEQSTSITFNCGGSDNRFTLSSRSLSSRALSGAEPRNGYLVNIRPGPGIAYIYRVVNADKSQLGAGVAIATNTNDTFNIRLEVTGASPANINVYLDPGSGTASTLVASRTDSAGALTGTFSGLSHNLYASGAARFDDFIVDDGVTAGGSVSEATLGAVLARQNLLASFSAGAALRAPGSSSAATDAALRTTASLAANLDAGIRLADALATALSAVLRSGRAVEASLDAIVSTAGASAQAQMDAATLRLAVLTALGVDSTLVSTGGLALQADAALRGGGAVVSDVDAALRGGGAVVSDVDAALRSAGAATAADIDAVLRGLVGVGTQLGAVLTASGTSTVAALDAAARAAHDAASVMGAAMQRRTPTPANMDAALVLTGLLSTALDSVLIEASAVAVALDSLLKQTGVRASVGMDAILSGSLTMGCPTATVLLYTAVDGSIVLGPAACSAVQTH